MVLYLFQSFPDFYLGYEIRDLNATGICFYTQTSNWGASNLTTTLKYTVCSNDFLLGGYDILKGSTDYFIRTYSNLPTHSMIYYTATVWAIDTWDLYAIGSTPPGDTFVLDFDGREFPGPYMRSNIFPTKTCGRLGNYDLGPIRVFGKVMHTISTLIIKVRAAFDEGPLNESFGFRNLNLLFVRNPDPSAIGSSTESFCALAPVTIPDKQCPCPEGQFQYPLTPFTCSPCHPICASCFDRGPRGCYQCVAGASFVNGQCIFCDASCKLCSGPGPAECKTCQPGLFLYQNKCIPECELPSVNTTDGCINSCSAPCSPSTKFLSWNGSCLDTCPFPLRQITSSTSIRKCEYPCETGEYLYWDGSCKNDCVSPLNIRIETGVQYCDYPCFDTEFLYINGTCSLTCSPPFKQRFDTGKQYCEFLCAPDEFLHKDGSCLSYCNFPFISLIYTGHKLCDSPCLHSSDYLYWNNSCGPLCPLPFQKFQIRNINYCIPKCLSDQYIFWNGSCISSCELPLQVQHQPFGDICLHPCPHPTDFYLEDTKTCSSTCISSSSIDNGYYFKCSSSSTIEASGLLVNLLLGAPFGSTSFITVAKLTRYVKYVDIKYPPRLENLRISGARSVLNLKFGPKIPHNVNSSFTKYPIPDIFERNHLHSSFFMNFWEELMSLGILLSIAIILMLFNLLAKKLDWPLFQKGYSHFRFIFKWNFILILFVVNLDEVIIYSALEFKTFKDNSVQAVFSFILGLLMFLSCFAVWIASLVLVSKTDKLKKLNKSQECPEEYEGYQVLFHGYRNNNSFNKRFFSFYLARFILPMIFASYCYTVPLLQVIMYLTINLFSLLIIVCKKPFEKRINYIQVTFIETLVLVNNICLLILTILDVGNHEYYNTFVLVGDLIIVSNVTINFLIIIFLLIKIGSEINLVYKQVRNEANQKKNIWSSILFIIIQQGGFGFEEARPIEIKASKQQNSYSHNNKSTKSVFQESDFEQNIFSETKEGFNKHGNSSSIVEHTKKYGAKKRLISQNGEIQTDSGHIDYENMNDELVLFEDVDIDQK